MSGSRTRLAIGATLAWLLAVPLLALVVQAAADEWRAPALVPQELGLRGLRAVAADANLLAAVANSAVVAAATTAAALVLGWPLARALAGVRAPLLWVLVGFPVLVPPLVIGQGLATWFLRLGLADRLVAVAAAHLVVVLPYVVVALTAAFGERTAELDASAAVLGAGPLRRLAQVVIPAVWPHVALAAALGFTVSWSQYGTSLAVGGGIPMLPLVLVPFVRADPQVAAVLELVFLAPPVVLLVAATRPHRPDRRVRRRAASEEPASSAINSPAEATKAGLVG